MTNEQLTALQIVEDIRQGYINWEDLEYELSNHICLNCGRLLGCPQDICYCSTMYDE